MVCSETITSDDARWLRCAEALAQRGWGRSAPNPAVGCVLVEAGGVVGRAWTADGGRPHAETQALAQAESVAHGATLYVTLEPCCHHGQTPPCTEAIIAAGVRRVVVQNLDSDPRMQGRGVAALRAAGVAVDVVDSTESTQPQRPYVVAKMAQSLDGRIALGNGVSQWISGPQARAFGHLLRAQSEAILVGSATVLEDAPRLTCRLPGAEGTPLRVIVDRRQRIPSAHPTLQQEGTTVVATRTRRWEDAPGVEVWVQDDEGDNLSWLMARLAERGVRRLLVEGGGTLLAALLTQRLVDRLYVVSAPLVIGAEGRPGVGLLGLESLEGLRRWVIVERLHLGEDVVVGYAPAGGLGSQRA